MGDRLELIKSSRKGQGEDGHSGMIGELRGYMFYFDRHSNNGERLYWNCMEKKSRKCKGRITTDLAFMVTKDDNNVHPNHIASAAKVEGVKAVAGMKRRAVEVMESTTAVVEKTRRDVSVAAMAHLPSKQSSARYVRRWRLEALAAPRLPISAEELVIPEMYKTYARQNPSGRMSFLAEPFLRYDSKDDEGYEEGNRCIFFASDRGLEMLEAAKEIYADGTFDITPGLFAQFYTVHVRYEKTAHTIPCLFAFMANRQKATYVRMFQHLRQLCPKMSPEVVMTDFEDAALKAYQVVWPNVQNKGCFFHLSQNQRRKIVKSGLQEFVDSDPSIDLQVRMVRAMAFIPIADLYEVWRELMDFVDERLDPLITYFDKHYMGQVVGRRRRRPTFPQDLWNMYDRTVQGLPRTNNSVEAYHRSLNTHFAVSHPSMWVACEKIQSYQQKLDSDYEEIIAGQHPVRTRPGSKWIKAEKRKHKCVLAYSTVTNKLDYLRGIAHNLSL
uniref:MULE transposase domain-containing protein n=1 Tax=Plectus sambesii TaxID=2011161 RepID=A0A914W7H6_9BILA